MIPETTIQTIKEGVDIISVIGEFVDLKKHGNGYRGKSPFNDEKTPSFYVVLSKGKPFFKDFSSGKSGDVITFLQEHLNITYIQAIIYLAQKQGLVIDGSQPYPTPAKPAIRKEQIEKPVIHIPEKWLKLSINSQQFPNHFLAFFKTRFGAEQVENIRTRFKIGYSGWRNGSNVFWYIDEQGNATQGKILLYDEHTGKRDQQTFNTVHSLLSKAGHIPADYTLRRTLFGMHQITGPEPIKCIGLVESEKTACICSILLPSVTWMATGGKEFFKEELIRPLKQLPIIVYPDLDAFDEWQAKSEPMKAGGYKITVSNLLQGYDPVSPKDDIADFLLRMEVKLQAKDPEYAFDGTLIHAEKGYPISWDLPSPPTPLEKMIKRNPSIQDLINRFDLVEIKRDQPKPYERAANCFH